MASKGYTLGTLGSLPAGVKEAVGRAFAYVLDNLRLGPCAPGTRAENLQLYAIEGTTHATPGTEFSIAHGLQRAPYLAVPVLCLTAAGGRLVPLTVTRAADAERVYLSSTVASATVRLLVEGAQ